MGTDQIKNDTIAKERKFFWGIDLLRLISIIAVVALHTLGRSGLLLSENSSQYRLAWLLETFAYFAVNVFCIISGFVQYSKHPRRFKLSRVISLWVTVVFYGLAITCAFYLFSGIEVGRNDFYVALMPIIKKEYWFFSAYIGMFIFSPLINALVRRANNKLIYLLIVLGLLLATYENVTEKLGVPINWIIFNRGYRFTWFIVMYLIGAIIRKTESYRFFHNKRVIGIIIAVGLLIFSWAWKVYIEEAVEKAMSPGGGVARIFIEYTSLTVIFASVLLVKVFANVNVGTNLQGFLRFVTPSVFSVYLLNSQPLIANHLYDSTHLAFLQDMNGIKLTVTVLGLCLGFTIASILIDRIRIILFDILKIEKIIKLVDNIIVL